jgi:GT2 family glycosyltransferase
VQKACTHIEAEIFVVDNNSTDGSREYLEPLFPKVKFTWNNENIGFAKANNLALENATGNYILFLNPDTIVPEDCFVKCIAYFETHPDAGAIGVRMVDGNGKYLKESKRGFPSPAASFYKMLGFASLFSRSKSFAKYYMGHLPENKTNEVEALAGAFMMIRKKILDKTGGFDERFFMYAEDIDLSYRIKEMVDSQTLKHYRNIYFPETTIIHFKGESTNRGSAKYIRLFYKAMDQFVDKHYSNRSAGFRLFIKAGIKLRRAAAMTGAIFKN